MITSCGPSIQALLSSYIVITSAKYLLGGPSKMAPASPSFTEAAGGIATDLHPRLSARPHAEVGTMD